MNKEKVIDPWFEKVEKQKWIHNRIDAMLISCDRCKHVSSDLCLRCTRGNTIKDYYERK